MLIDEINQLYNVQVIENMGNNNWKLWTKMYEMNNHLKKEEDETCSKTLDLAPMIPSEITRSAIIEFKSNISNASEELTEAYDKVVSRIDETTEMICAFGGLILKPYVDNDKLKVAYLNRDLFIPLNFSSDKEITHIVFIERVNKIIEENKEKKTYYYTKLEEHEQINNGCIIRNRAFVSDSIDNLGEETVLSDIEYWAHIPEEITIDNLPFPLYVYAKYPMVNNIDPNSPMGISCFARAINLIQDADEQYSRIDWEFTGSELAIDADLTALDKDALPKHGKRLYRGLGLSAEDGFYNVFSPNIRDVNLYNGLNQILRKIEFNCGLSYGLISDVQEVSKTATEMKISKQRFYVTVSNLQNEIKDMLEKLINIMAVLNNESYETIEASFEFDDSIITDSTEDQKIMLAEVAAGILKPEVYLMRRYGVTEEQAKALMPSMVDDSVPDYGEE